MSKKLTADDIERKKDYLDLAPSIKFTEDHLSFFKNGFSRLCADLPANESSKWSNTIKPKGIEDIVYPQLHPKTIRKILEYLPGSLQNLSMLKTVRYFRVVPVPEFDQYGNFLPKKVQYVEVEDFPRSTDHPTRILVGSCSGEEINLTPIPSSVSTTKPAVWYYQLHVFLHELFHTIEYLRRDPKIRSNIILKTDGTAFTFQYWWDKFEELILSKREPISVSRYAATYRTQLIASYKRRNPKKFTAALAEQICETFVAYMLNIIANDDGWTDFRQESFGNKKQAELFMSEQAPAANEKWILMDQLCRAEMIQKD